MHITGLLCQVPVSLHLVLEEMNRGFLRANVEQRPWAAPETGTSLLTRGAGHFGAREEWVRVRELAALSWHMVPHRLSAETIYRCPEAVLNATKCLNVPDRPD